MSYQLRIKAPRCRQRLSKSFHSFYEVSFLESIGERVGDRVGDRVRSVLTCLDIFLPPSLNAMRQDTLRLRSGENGRTVTPNKDGKEMETPEDKKR